MRVVRFCTLLIPLLLCIRVSFALQSNTPEGALEEMVTADTLNGVIKHLPLKVQETIEKLSAKEKERLAGKLVARNVLRTQGMTFHKRDDGSAWEIVNDKQQVEGSIKLKNSFVSGTDALLVLEVTENKHSDPDRGSNQDETMEKRHMRMLVSLRQQEGEWRLMEFGLWQAKNLESEDFISGLGVQVNGESAAISTLYVLNAALEEYKSAYPKMGLPASLEALSGPQGAEASAEHAMLLPPGFFTAPLVKDGYRFQYTLVDPGTETGQKGLYRITATPIEFSANSGRSLFTDQTQLIHATTDQRDANENDDVLRGGQQQDDN